jgi:hypothetical protein
MLPLSKGAMKSGDFGGDRIGTEHVRVQETPWSDLGDDRWVQPSGKKN